MLAYLLRYIGNFSSRYELLRKPTRDDAKFAWTNERQTVFEDLKKAIISIPVLISNYPRPLKSATELYGTWRCSFSEDVARVSTKQQSGKRFFILYILKAGFHSGKYGSDRTFSILYYPHRRTKKVENTSTLYLWITVSKWNRKLVRKAHARVQFCCDVFRSRAYFPEWKPALIVQDHPVW